MIDTSKRCVRLGFRFMSVLINRSGSVPLIQSSLLSEEPGLVHGFTSREGGVSQGYLSTLNLSFTRGDKEENVRENFRRLGETIGFGPERFVLTDQTHTRNVRLVTKEDAGKGLTRPRDYRDVDGLVTNQPGLVLSVFVADCQPVLLYDPKHRAVAAVHSGWRGTVGRISGRALQMMKEHFATDPADVIAVVGPSICPNCYEVSEDVAEAFRQEFSLSDKILTPGRLAEDGRHYQLNLWEAVRVTLLDLGCRDCNIDILGLCTKEHADKLFSHRASGGKRGNMAGVIALL